MIRGVFPVDLWNFKTESVLSDLPKEELDLLFANISEDIYEKSQVIFREGAYPTGIYFIRQGKVKKV